MPRGPANPTQVTIRPLKSVTSRTSTTKSDHGLKLTPQLTLQLLQYLQSTYRHKFCQEIIVIKVYSKSAPIQGHASTSYSDCFLLNSY